MNLGAPYEAIISRVIEEGYAGNQSEVIRQALLAYGRMLEEEEVKLVNRGIESEMQEIKSGKLKVKGMGQLRKKYKL